jgi:hypothetical protein
MEPGLWMIRMSPLIYPGRNVATAAEAEPLLDAPNVRLHSGCGQAEPPSDQDVFQSIGDEQGDLLLTLREAHARRVRHVQVSRRF